MDGTIRAAAATAALLISAAVVAPNASAGKPAPDVILSTKTTVERVWVPAIGEYKDVSGTETVVSSPSKKATTGFAALSASGCTITKFAGDPYKVRSSSAPYYNYVVNSGYESLSSGCAYRDFIYMTLKQSRWLGGVYHPTVDSDDNTVYPGQGRAYVNVSYRCGSTTYTFYTESDLTQGVVSNEVRLCP